MKTVFLYATSLIAIKAMQIEEMTRVYNRVFFAPDEFTSSVLILSGESGEFKMEKKRHFTTPDEAIRGFELPALYTQGACELCDKERTVN